MFDVFTMDPAAGEQSSYYAHLVWLGPASTEFPLKNVPLDESPWSSDFKQTYRSV